MYPRKWFAIAALLLGTCCIASPLRADDADDDERPHIVIMIAENEYRTARTLPVFAEEHLRQDFRVTILQKPEGDRHDFPGLEILDDADLLFLSVRRRILTTEQFAPIRRYIAAGKPVIGIRTSCHAFELRDKDQMPEGDRDPWPNFDGEIFGGNYARHYPSRNATFITVVEEAADHPILTGVEANELRVGGSLYQSAPLEEGTVSLITGYCADNPVEPVAWTFQTPTGGRSFYTSLGHHVEFDMPVCERIFTNAVYWALELEVPETLPGEEAAAE